MLVSILLGTCSFKRTKDPEVMYVSVGSRLNIARDWRELRHILFKKITVLIVVNSITIISNNSIYSGFLALLREARSNSGYDRVMVFTLVRSGETSENRTRLLTT